MHGQSIVISLNGANKHINFMSPTPDGWGFYSTADAAEQEAIEATGDFKAGGIILISVLRSAEETEAYIAERKQAAEDAAKAKEEKYAQKLAKQAENTENTEGVVYKDVTRMAEAVRILTDDYNVDCSAVRSKADAKELAKSVGVDFPNLK